MTPSRWRIQRLDVTASTNDDVCRAAEAGEAEGLVIVAERQSAGRGRLGRVWESPAGNLYCSALLRPKDMPRGAGLYSFVAALAVHDTVEEALAGLFPSPWGGARGEVDGHPKDHHPERTQTPRLPLVPAASGREALVTLKWPNDVLVQGKKISGILLEVAGDALIVGIGVNIAHFPETALYPATSLHQEFAAHERERIPFPLCGGGLHCALGEKEQTLEYVLKHLLNHLSRWHDRMQAEGFAPIREAWLKHAQQGTLTVRLPTETLQGTFAGIDPTGALRLVLADGVERSISTGDVVLPLKD